LQSDDYDSKQSSRNAEPDMIAPKDLIKIDMFELAGNATNEACVVCSIMWSGISTLGAHLPPPHTNATVAVVARPRKPMYITWNAVDSSGAAEIYYSTGMSLP